MPYGFRAAGFALSGLELQGFRLRPSEEQDAADFGIELS